MNKVTKEWAIEKAQALIVAYPNKKTVQEIIDEAIANQEFTNNTEMMAVWGRLHRLVGAK